MGILMIVILLGIMATMVLVSITAGRNYIKKSTLAIRVTALALCIIVTGMTFGYSIKTMNDVVGPAQEVGLINPPSYLDSGNVYFDDNTGEYFIIKTDAWNVVNPVYRSYLDNEVAKNYADSYSNLMDTFN